MKKILIGMLSIAGLVFSAQAQETRILKEKGAHHQKRLMSAGLNLTDAQKEQMKIIHESSRAQMADLEKQETLTVKEYKEKKASILKAQKEKISGILTDDQKAKLKETKSERKGKHKMHRGHNFDQLKGSLDLSDEQVTRLKANRESHKTAVMEIRKNAQLNAAEKQDKLEELKKKNKSTFEEILTPEQLQKMKEVKKERTRE